MNSCPHFPGDSWGGRVLRAQRLPDHRPADRPVEPARPAGPARVLGPAGPPAAARPGGRARRGDRGHGRDRTGPAGRAAVGAARRRHLLQQLVAGAGAPVLLRAVRAAATAPAPVVTGHRGAVLPGVAAAPDRDPQDLPVPPPPGRARLVRRGPVRPGHGRWSTYPAGTRPGSTTAPTPTRRPCSSGRHWRSPGRCAGCGTLGSLETPGPTGTRIPDALGVAGIAVAWAMGHFAGTDRVSVPGRAAGRGAGGRRVVLAAAAPGLVAGRSGGPYCAGSGSGPTGSTCGTGRSSRWPRRRSRSSARRTGSGCPRRRLASALPPPPGGGSRNPSSATGSGPQSGLGPGWSSGRWPRAHRSPVGVVPALAVVAALVVAGAAGLRGAARPRLHRAGRADQRGGQGQPAGPGRRRPLPRPRPCRRAAHPRVRLPSSPAGPVRPAASPSATPYRGHGRRADPGGPAPTCSRSATRCLLASGESQLHRRTAAGISVDAAGQPPGQAWAWSIVQRLAAAGRLRPGRWWSRARHERHVHRRARCASWSARSPRTGSWCWINAYGGAVRGRAGVNRVHRRRGPPVSQRGHGQLVRDHRAPDQPAVSRRGAPAAQRGPALRADGRLGGPGRPGGGRRGIGRLPGCRRPRTTSRPWADHSAPPTPRPRPPTPKAPMRPLCSTRAPATATPLPSPPARRDHDFGVAGTTPKS